MKQAGDATVTFGGEELNDDVIGGIDVICGGEEGRIGTGFRGNERGCSRWRDLPVMSFWRISRNRGSTTGGLQDSKFIVFGVNTEGGKEKK